MDGEPYLRVVWTDPETGRKGYVVIDRLVRGISGGGTRAAAFSFGVLTEIDRTRLPGRLGSGSLLDRVDFVSGVSGGSAGLAASTGLIWVSGCKKVPSVQVQPAQQKTAADHRMASATGKRRMGRAARTEALGKWHTRRKLRNISIPFAFLRPRRLCPKRCTRVCHCLLVPGAP